MWRFLHNCVAHPLLFFSGDSRWAVSFHDYSSIKMHEQYPKLYKKLINMTQEKIERFLMDLVMMKGESFGKHGLRRFTKTYLIFTNSR